MLLITGSHGQLGTELAALLPEAILTDVDELDITDLAAVKARLESRIGYSALTLSRHQTSVRCWVYLVGSR